MTEGLSILAPAKINLFLHVLGRRADGYHEVETLLQTVDLFDTISVELGGDEVELDVTGPDIGPTEQNLAYRAAVAFRARAAIDVGVRIRLEKRIPAGAGLGGGSSDAAAVLRCMAELHDGGEPEWLMALAASLGSDVPFFLGASTLAFATGRGESLEGLEPLPVRHVVLSLTPVHVATGEAYELLGAPPIMPHGSAERTRAPDVASWDAALSLAHNDFERVVSGAHQEVERALAALRREGAELAMLSGSGGACFGVFPDTDVAARAAARLEESLGWPFAAVRTLSCPPRPVRQVAEGG